MRIWASEHGHYLSFLQLARHLQTTGQVDGRWNELLNAEAAIIQAQSPGPRMHSAPSLVP